MRGGERGCCHQADIASRAVLGAAMESILQAWRGGEGEGARGQVRGEGGGDCMECRDRETGEGVALGC